jgi:hypothetical protein
VAIMVENAVKIKIPVSRLPNFQKPRPASTTATHTMIFTPYFRMVAAETSSAPGLFFMESIPANTRLMRSQARNYRRGR